MDKTNGREAGSSRSARRATWKDISDTEVETLKGSRRVLHNSSNESATSDDESKANASGLVGLKGTNGSDPDSSRETKSTKLKDSRVTDVGTSACSIRLPQNLANDVEADLEGLQLMGWARRLRAPGRIMISEESDFAGLASRGLAPKFRVPGRIGKIEIDSGS